MTGDVSSAVEGALEAGIQDVLVLNSHRWDMNNILIEEFHPRAKLIQRTHTILDPSFSAVLCVGFHVRADTAEGIRSHTLSSLTVLECKLNDEPFGEFLLVAGTAG
jgi:D-aminopeptidase